MTSFIKKMIGSVLDQLVDRVRHRIMSPETPASMKRRRDGELLEHWARRAAAAPNTFLKFGAKYFSQNDEDGLILEIVRRIGIANGTFLEIGVGKGTENNTIILLMTGWSGVWIGGERLEIDTQSCGNLAFRQAIVTPENVPDLVRPFIEGSRLPAAGPDLLSVDIDSYDRDVVASLLGMGMRPQVIVVEYNGKFPPPIRFSVPAPNRWDGSDYMGCSLQSWMDLLQPCGYRLIACNLTGVNAFFVQEQHMALFPETPAALADVFMPCDYNWFVGRGHPTSPRTVQAFLSPGRDATGSPTAS